MSDIRGSEGDTGSQRPGGLASGDAFTKREAALENQYIHQKEMEKLKAQSDKLAAKGQSSQGEKK